MIEKKSDDERYKQSVMDELFNELIVLDSIDLQQHGFSEDGADMLKTTLHHALEYIHCDGHKLPLI